MDDKLRAAAQAVLDDMTNDILPDFVRPDTIEALRDALQPEKPLKPLKINDLTVEDRIASLKQAPLAAVEKRAAVADHLRELYAEYRALAETARNDNNSIREALPAFGGAVCGMETPVQAAIRTMQKQEAECIRLRAEALKLKKEHYDIGLAHGRQSHKRVWSTDAEAHLATIQIPIVIEPDDLRAIIEERDQLKQTQRRTVDSLAGELTQLRVLSWEVIAKSRWDSTREQVIVGEQAWNRLRNFLHPPSGASAISQLHEDRLDEP
jgi:hypothetical protein